MGSAVDRRERPGGNGLIALDAARRSPPDGYTLLQADAPPMTRRLPCGRSCRTTRSRTSSRSLRLYRTYYFITVAADSKWNNVADLINAAKAKPGDLTYGSSGVGGNLHIGGAAMENASGRQDDARSVQGNVADLCSHRATVTSHGRWEPRRPPCPCSRRRRSSISLSRAQAKRHPARRADRGRSAGTCQLRAANMGRLCSHRTAPRRPSSTRSTRTCRKCWQDPQVKERLAAVGFEPLPGLPTSCRR